MRKMNNSAQWQLIEVIIVAGILFGATYLVRSANITVYKSIEEENPFKAQGYDALESLASQPAPVDNYDSLLVYCLFSDTGSLKSNITSFFSSDVNFKINIVNMTELRNNQTKDLVDCTTILVESIYWVDEESTTATRIVNHDGNVYKVVLYLWYNLGG